MLRTFREKVLFAILVLVFIVFLGYTIDRNEWLSDEDIVDHFFSFLFVVVGAMYAFSLSNLRDEIKKREGWKVKINFAMFVMYKISLTAKSLDMEMSKYELDEELAFNFPHIEKFGVEDVCFDLEGLSFLLDSNDPQLLMVMDEEMRVFHNLLYRIKERTRFYVEEILPALDRADLCDKAEVHEQDIRGAVNERTLNQYLTMVGEIRGHVRIVLNGLLELHSRFVTVCLRDYPDLKLVRFSAKSESNP